MSELDPVLRDAGARLLETIREHPAWSNLNTEGRSLLAEAVHDATRLTALKLAGADVEAELAHVRAAIANWTFVQAAEARTALREGLDEAASVVGSLLRGFVLGV